ncbi:LytR C-terminal domain-containing protein [Microbacterium sp. STN6]|uniref:LytR C-terminal domain-containing protein n=1 Tax=Microbacterium sp. STN6 TaxID=2995588 RepID=UPI002260B48B|nr:LytR C-terminal domain-containing protein [Microbacterium sp. STN6]MCX7523397.1 LytR C-terminal domain-containing protein [Microbacterium sp. STN6]
MAHRYPKDRFDTAPERHSRIGAHRAPARRGRGWIGFAWAALATVILVGIGVVWILQVNNSINVPKGFGFFGSDSTPTATATSTPTPTITPTIDPKLSVMVLNGTPTTGLAGDVANQLSAAGWTIASRGNASENDITKTVVYYSDDANEGAALGAAKSLKGAKVSIVKTDAYVDSGAALTVVVGSDYAGG